MMYYFIAIINVLAAAFAQMLLKKSANKNHNGRLIQDYVNPWVISGYSIMGVTLVINVFIMGNGVKLKELSIIESFSYLFIPALSYTFFKEKITPKKLFSILLIFGGILTFFI